MCHAGHTHNKSPCFAPSKTRKFPLSFFHCLLSIVYGPGSSVCFFSRPPLTFDVAVLSGGGIKLHDIARAVEAIFSKSPPGSFLIIIVALENGRALEAKLARPITCVLTTGINEPVENGSVACLIGV